MENNPLTIVSSSKEKAEEFVSAIVDNTIADGGYYGRGKKDPFTFTDLTAPQDLVEISNKVLKLFDGVLTKLIEDSQNIVKIAEAHDIQDNSFVNIDPFFINK